MRVWTIENGKRVVKNIDFAATEEETAVPQVSEEERRAVAEARRAERIEALKERLAESDYKALKYAEGWLTDAEYAEVKAARQALRDEINRLEALTAEEMIAAESNDNDNNNT